MRVARIACVPSRTFGTGTCACAPAAAFGRAPDSANPPATIDAACRNSRLVIHMHIGIFSSLFRPYARRHSILCTGSCAACQGLLTAQEQTLACVIAQNVPITGHCEGASRLKQSH